MLRNKLLIDNFSILDVSAESKKFVVDAEGLMKVESAKSTAMVKGDINSATNCEEKHCIEMAIKAN